MRRAIRWLETGQLPPGPMAPYPRLPGDDDITPALKTVTLRLCEPCLHGAGGTCGSWGCTFWGCTRPGLPVQEYQEELPTAGLSILPAILAEHPRYQALFAGDGGQGGSAPERAT